MWQTFARGVALAQTTTGNTQSLEDGWRTSITLQGNSPFQGLITFDAGGGLVDTQQIDLSQQATPGIGSWVSTGGSAFALNFFKIASDNKGNLNFTVRFVITIQLSGDQNSFQGSGTFTVFDPNGNTQFTHTLQFNGTRIQHRASIIVSVRLGLLLAGERLEQLSGRKVHQTALASQYLERDRSCVFM